MGLFGTNVVKENERGLKKMALNDHAGAVPHFLRAVKAAPHDHVYWWNLGIAKAHSGDREGAAAAIREYVRLGGDPTGDGAAALEQLASGGTDWLRSAGAFVAGFLGF